MFTELNQNLLIREWLNGALFPLSVNLALIIGVYLLQSYRYGKARGVPWSSLSGVKTAHALFWVFVAESVRAGIVWATLRGAKGAAFSVTLETANILLVIGAGILTVSILRCTYIFTPPHYRRVYWAFSLATTIGFLFVSYAFTEYASILH